MDQRDAPSGGSGDSAGHQRGAPSRGSGGGAAHHAVFAIEDVLGHALSYLSFPRDLTSAEVSRAWRRAWHATATGLLRPLRRVDGLSGTTNVTARDGGGAVVASYSTARHGAYGASTDLLLLTARGDLGGHVDVEILGGDISFASVCLLDDGTAWVIDGDRLNRLRLDDGEVLANISYREPFIEPIELTSNEAIDLALAGDALLVLRLKGVEKRCGSTGNLLSTFAEDLFHPTALAMAGGLIYISEKRTDYAPVGVWRGSNRPETHMGLTPGYVHVFNVATETRVRTFGDETSSARFDMPTGVAVSDDRMYVAESHWEKGSQIQVLSLPKGEVLQIIPSPTTPPSYDSAFARQFDFQRPDGRPDPKGDFVGGLCVDRGRLWAVGPSYSRTYVRVLVPYPQLLG